MALLVQRKKITVKLLATFFVALFISQGMLVQNANAVAGVSSKLSYQGRLTDANGNPLGGGAGTNYYVCFSIYDAVSAGTKLWPAGVPNNNTVLVTSGVFNANIGTADALNFDFSSNDTVYLNVGVSATNVACDNVAVENLTPRQRVDATAYARVAADVYGTALRTSSTRVQAGIGTGQGTPIFTRFDNQNTAATIGGACPAGAVNGDMWYNSNNGKLLACNANVIQVMSLLGNQFFDVSGPTAARTYAFPDSSATVLTSATAVTAGQGGTGQAGGYAIGDMLYASAASALSKLADVAAGSYLRSGGVTTAPLWSTLTLPNASAQGDIFVSTGANAMTTLAKDINATRYLSNTGATNNPAWAQINLTNGVTGTIGTANLGSGTANSTTYLRGDQTWATVSGGTNTLLDGTSHTDTAAGTVVRGDLITGQTATPKWTRLAKGTANQVLSMDGTATDIVWATPSGGGTPAGANTNIQFNNAGVFGGSNAFVWDNAANDLKLLGTDTGIVLQAITNEPSVPAAGTGQLYAKSIGGRILPKFVGPSGIDFAVQPLMAQDKVAIWSPPGNAATLPGVFGFTAPTAVGTATTRSVTTASLFTRVRRLGYLSAATAAAFAGHYNVAAGTQWTIGTGAGLGGFFYVVRFGDSSAATVAGSREFVGMTSTVVAPANVEPSTLLNSIGVGHGTADTNLKIFYGGSAAQAPIDLGVNFPARTLSTDMYELILFASPASNTTVGYKVTRLNTGAVAEGTLTAAVAGTQLPAATTLLGHRAWITNNATLLAVGMDIASVYISSDY